MSSTGSGTVKLLVSLREGVRNSGDTGCAIMLEQSSGFFSIATSN